MEKNWEQLLTELKEGKTSELPVSLEEYPEFRQVWLTFPNRMHFRGIASLGGNITYVYDPDSDPGKKAATEENSEEN